jgi:hypothetical protein
MSSLTP